LGQAVAVVTSGREEPEQAEVEEAVQPTTGQR
jgi:hypothetical protein